MNNHAFLEGHNCSKRCITEFLSSLNCTPSFFKKMESFVISSSRTVNPCKLQLFIQDLINKKSILCEVGLFYTEKYLFNAIYQNSFFYENCGRNIFINNKIMLYSWINLEHLEIQIVDENTIYYIFEEQEILEKVKNIKNIFRNIENTTTCSEKIDVMMETIRLIYNLIGVDQGNDKFFPFFVFILLKSKVKNLLLHFKFIQKYKRKRFTECKKNCHHLVNLYSEKICECFLDIEYNIKEIDYYLTTFEAAILFIERLEFNVLKISKCEYEEKFSHNVKKIEFEKPLVIKKKKNGLFKRFVKTMKNPFEFIN